MCFTCVQICGGASGYRWEFTFLSLTITLPYLSTSTWITNLLIWERGLNTVSWGWLLLRILRIHFSNRQVAWPSRSFQYHNHSGGSLSSISDHGFWAKLSKTKDLYYTSGLKKRPAKIASVKIIFITWVSHLFWRPAGWLPVDQFQPCLILPVVMLILFLSVAGLLF